MQIQQSPFIKEDIILQESGISIQQEKDLILNLISELLLTKRSDSVVNELKSKDLWKHILNDVSGKLLTTDRDVEKLWVYVNGPIVLCPLNKTKEFVCYAVGYKNCGKPSVCQCNKNSIAKKISESKLSYDDQKKKEISDKRKATNLELYGYENPFSEPDVMKEFYLESLGVDNPNKSSAVRDKIKKTNMERYGFETPAQNKTVAQKAKDTIKSKYGVTSLMQLSWYREKIKATLFKNYGVSHQMHSNIVKDKLKQTNIEKYGVDNVRKSPEIKKKISESFKHTIFKRLVNRLQKHNITPFSNMEDFNGVKLETQWICSNCNNVFEGKVSHTNNHGVPRCFNCFPSHMSSTQTDIVNYIASIIGIDNILVNDRSILINENDARKNKELDIYISSFKLAIEFCGLRWHTELHGNKTKEYHYDKWKRCNNLGIQLITIFGDEWSDKKHIVESILLNKLSRSKKIYARKTIISAVTSKIAKEFYNKNHINGYVNCKYHYGLFFENELLMCMSFSKPRFNAKFDYELIRMASKLGTVIVGGASKLFTYFVNNIRVDSILSYCDLKYGNGSVYLNLGFEKIQVPTIGYHYININRPYERINRMHFQKHKLGDIGDKTAAEFLIEQGYDKIWDCGHQKYLWQR